MRRLGLLTTPTFFEAWGFVFLGAGLEDCGKRVGRWAAQTAYQAQQAAYE